MKDPLIILFVDLFYKLEKDGKDGYIMLKLSVPLKLLYNLYEKLILVDVPAIEKIPLDEKEVFWNKEKEFYTDELTAIKASKAAYVLSLITN